MTNSPHPELDDTPLNHFMEQRVFDVRDLHVTPLAGVSDDHIPEAYAIMRDGLTFVVLPSFATGRLALEITAWRSGERAGETITVTLSYDDWEDMQIAE